MARSYKKNPFFYICSANTSDDKKEANRMFRRISKHLLIKGEEVLPVRLREINDVWSWGVDGPKHYWADATAKDMRK